MQLDLNILKKLCLANGVAGNEENVSEKIIAEISKLDVEYSVDSLGNIIVLKRGKNRPLTRLMVSCHMDEVGLIITKITKEGYLGFDTVGGIDAKILPASFVFVGKNQIPGVIASKPVHLQKKSDISEETDVESLLIDIGAKNKEEAEKFVNLGDTATFNSIFDEFENRIISKALDDRIGCFLLINLIRQDLEYDTYFVFTTQEEIGLRGAQVAAYTVNPQAALILEATTANDIEGIEDHKKVCILGNGPAVSFMDRRNFYCKEYFDLAIKTAKENNLNIQIKCGINGANDSGSISVSREGVKTLALSIPCRYLHCSASIICKNDLDHMFLLSSVLINKISSKKFN